MSVVPHPHPDRAAAPPIAVDLERIRLTHRAQRIEHVLRTIERRRGRSGSRSAERLQRDLATELRQIEARLRRPGLGASR